MTVNTVISSVPSELIKMIDFRAVSSIRSDVAETY